MGATSRVAGSAATLGAATALFFPAFALHEALHAAVVRALGHQAAVVIRPWRFALFNLALPSVHVQPVPPLDDARQLLDNFAGPALAAAVLAALGLLARPRWLRLALAANVCALLFYAAVEPLDVLADTFGQDITPLVTPELNYGVPLAMFLVAAAAWARRPTPGRRAPA